MANPLFPQSNKSTGNPLINMIRSMGSPQAAYNYLMQNNMQATLPNGQKVTIDQFANMMQGKNVNDACREFGVTPSQIL
mgnify:CR=1 FL=1